MMKGSVLAVGSATQLYLKGDRGRYLHRPLEGDEAGSA